MSNTLAQNPTAATFSNVSSVNKTFASACTNGSLIVASCSEDHGNTIAITDNGTGSYATDATFLQNTNGATGGGRISISSKQNTNTSALTVTATFGAGGSYGALKVYELTGQATSSVVDTNVQTGNAFGPGPSISLTTGSANCTVIEASLGYHAGAVADTNYTAAFSEAVGSNAYHFGEYRVDAGAAGAITLTLGGAAGMGDNQWGAVAVAYKTAAGGGGPPALTGVAGAGAVGTLAPATSPPLTGVAGAGAVGTLAPATTHPLTGVAAAGAVGTMVPVITVAATGVAAAGAVGTLPPATTVPLTGVAGAGAVGAFAPNTTVPLTGVSAAAAVGNLSPNGDVALPLTGVTAVGAVGTVAPGVTVALTGVAAAGAVGSFGPATSPAATGVAAAGAVGTLAPTTTVALTGAQAAGQVGTITMFSPDVVVALTGVSAIGSVGNLGPVGGDIFVNPIVFGPTKKQHEKWKQKRTEEVAPPAPAPAPAPPPVVAAPVVVVSEPVLTDTPDDIMVYEAVFTLVAKGFFDA